MPYPFPDAPAIEDPDERRRVLLSLSAASGLPCRAIAATLEVSRQSLCMWVSGETARWRGEAALLEMWDRASAKAAVEALGLWEDENVFRAVRHIKRKLRLSVQELAALAGVASSTPSAWLFRQKRPSPPIVKRVAEICQEHGISRSDLETESRMDSIFGKPGAPPRNEQILFFAGDPSIPLRAVLRKAREDTGMMFKDMAASIGTSRTNFSHFTRTGGVLPSADKQKALFGCLAEAYSESGVECPLVVRTQNIETRKR